MLGEFYDLRGALELETFGPVRFRRQDYNETLDGLEKLVSDFAADKNSNLAALPQAVPYEAAITFRAAEDAPAFNALATSRLVSFAVALDRPELYPDRWYGVTVQDVDVEFHGIRERSVRRFKVKVTHGPFSRFQNKTIARSCTSWEKRARPTSRSSRPLRCDAAANLEFEKAAALRDDWWRSAAKSARSQGTDRNVSSLGTEPSGPASASASVSIWTMRRASEVRGSAGWTR